MAEDIMNFGGGGKFDMFRAKVNSGATGYDIVQADGTTTADVPVEATLKLKGYMAQTGISVDDAGGKIAVTNHDTRAAVVSGVKTLAPLTGSGAGATVPAAIVMEHGPSRGGPGGSSATNLGYWIYYANLDNVLSPDDATARMMYWGFGTLDPSSHNKTYKYDAYINDVITVNPVKPDYAYAGLAALVDTTYVDAVALPLAQYQSMDYGYQPWTAP